MLSKKITYAGNNIFKINFGLYGFDDIDFYKSKKEILENFKSLYEDILKKTLKKIGLKYCGLKYYSPQYYNYSNDSIDLIIRVINKNLFKKYILRYKDLINQELDKNKSYDGYMALTTPDTDTELTDLKNKPLISQFKSYEPDTIVLSVILTNLIDFSDFNINDYMVFECD